MSASTTTRSTSSRAHRAAAQRRWRAESGRQRSVRVALVSLGRLYAQLDSRGRRLLTATVGVEAMWMAIAAAAAQDGLTPSRFAEAKPAC